MDVSELDRGEVTAVLGGLLLGISLLLGWYHLGNEFATLGSCRGPHSTCTGWHALEYLRYAIIIGALAPLVLAYVVVRRQALSWPRGELTAVLALAALTLIIFRGIIDKPGYPTGEVSVSIGWFVALVGGLLMLLGAVIRTHESSTRRKPPGVL